MSFPYVGDQLDLPGDSRTPLRIEFELFDLDMTGATLAGQVRASANQASGSPLLALSFSTPVVTTESFKIDGVTKTGPVSRFICAANEAQMEALPISGNPDQAIRLPYDIHATVNTVKRTLCYGNLVVRPGVTND